jgi:hypothetical protein
MRVCACIGCPAHEGSCPDLTQARRCPRCGTQAELRRGTRQQRGYNAEHDRLRAQWKPKVEAGQVDCHARVCLMPIRRILIGARWDMGHTDDRTTWTGPEHRRCNRAAGGKAAHATPHAP